jgi:hypothetical protein
VPTVSQKIGVSFAVEGTAADDVVRLNTTISEPFGSEIRFGPAGNSRPHVTIALGTTNIAALTDVTSLVDEAVRTIVPFPMRIGLAARETVTGRYVLADAELPALVRQWRRDLRTTIGCHLTGEGRMTDDAHLTVAVIEGHDNAVDQLLARTDLRIADCTVTHIDVAHAGARGAKGGTIQRVKLGAI